MTAIHERLEEIFAGYREALAACAARQKPTDGLFGFGKALKDDACHERFDEQLGQAVAELAQPGLAAQDAAGAARMIYTQTSLHAYPESAQWMLYAAERHILRLIPYLTREDAEVLRAEYGKRYKRWNRLPVQRQVYDALKNRAHSQG